MTPQQLKNAILQLAIQGKLVEQRKEEGTGEELYKEIQEEKKKLIKEGKLKKQKALPEINEDEIPFDIPETWKWVRLGELVTVYGGKRIPAGRKLSLIKTEHVYIRVSDMKDGYVSTEKLHYVPNDIYEKISNYIIKKEDVFITVAGTIGRVGKIPHELDGANLTENADRLVFSIINQDWLIKAMQSNLVQQQIKNVTTKVGQPKLAINKIQMIVIPIPPLAEQKRIVEKIEQLLLLVDRYEKAWTRLEELNKKFPLDMQKAILQEAIQGKLVEQKKEEGTGEELFKEIQEEKQKLIEEGKLKKQKALPEITEDEIPFDIPETWKWVRSSDILYITMGQSPKAENINNNKLGCEFHQGKSNFGEMFLNKSEVYTTVENKVIEDPAIVMSVRAPVGDVNLVKNKIYIGRGLASFQIYTECDLLYIYYYFLTIKKSLERVSTGSTFKAINSDIVNRIIIPLPPLDEQKRIVEKIEQLLHLCEKLK